MMETVSRPAVEIADHMLHDVKEGVAHLAAHLHEGVCGLRGHDLVLQIERDRLYLRCMNCGHETHGWDIPHATARH